MPHDIFISHSTHDDGHIAGLMCSELEAHGFSCWIAPRDIAPGENWPEAIMRGLDNSRMVLLLFSQNSNQSEHVRREIVQAMDKNKALLPVRIENIQPGPKLTYSLTGIQWFDAFAPPIESHFLELRQQVARILERLDKPPQPPNPLPPPPQTQPGPNGSTKQRIVLLLLEKRNTQQEAYVLQLLTQKFREAGCEVFMDRDLQFGMEWGHEIERLIRLADAVVPILSEASAQNEMVSFEMQIACKVTAEQNGKPRLLPVRVMYEKSLGDALDAALQPLQCALWHGPKDDDAVIAQLLQALEDTEAPSEDRGRGGPVPANSKFYIPRPSDEALAQALRRKDTIVLVKGSRQMGKTSLVARGLHQARASSATVVYTDFQKMNSSDLTGVKPFYIALARMLADSLEIDAHVEDIADIADTWKETKAPNINFEHYLKKQILPRANGHLFWALDEVDRLFTTDFGSEVFGLFRSWHNERAGNPDTPLNDLTMIISYATEAHLFIADPNQSPFNVGTKLELRDFSMEQEEALNKLFGKPLFSDDQISRFYALVNGQPYLAVRGLNQLSTTRMPFEDFAATADRDEGPFGDHLKRILVMLARDAKMVEAVRSVLDGTNSMSMESFYRLRAAGIVVGEGAFNAKMRCLLYANYLRGHLRESA